ncbi:hypothetical protein M409DRAFT_62016 [Zasmidium cellare ATCC 36951]|uniref:Uncharacterized protein n=1 Tax=Zasmidium cellare ATCC 36951 TaxID=1080233 RepID=A0A6A6D3Q9_ZASCE|nr:uncharacterized protein M409DRAFT_62016 [Zasmidium cellare ATCC 36951]KAF2173743.1 hypothetical protein M409DRAFT_62016 [Zasmidium cellare ATCC 36951]
MAPMVPPLAQSDSKARFFARLGLDSSNPTHKRVYSLMKLEAGEGRRRLMESQTSSTAQIHEAAWQREVLRIFEHARPETRAVYQFGHDTSHDASGNEVVDNWIIRWMLWHVFRYRDYRNRSRPPGPNPPPPPSSSSSSDDEQGPPSTGSGGVGGSSSSSARKAKAIGSPSNPYWDPIRDQWQN